MGRRPDGYHLLDSLVVFAGVGDVITACPASSWSLTVTGPQAAGLPTGGANLVERAGRALASRHGGLAARVSLEKNLPVASGIGGGSADAAATLRLLARRWDLRADLYEIAAGLGADVPVCLASRPARMAGIGEILAPAPVLPAFGLALVNPGVALGTAAVFAARTGPSSSPAMLPSGWTDAAAMAADLARLGNDLEPPALRLAPQIGDVIGGLQASTGCLLARMSGSGATCFGLFETPDAAAAAANTLGRGGWWAWGGAPFVG